ncbi:hypothetical protein [Paracraurococcus lichenis]|uniref:Uncharacterized protein n=1 Tax=Paracraurococcus lichenis TaxID=3064888 RepID=A0ABT9DYD1_9PROT|nr:hypothetical protein [Paracraurococcus sp. LOR1-02]MDO9708911.1 hypothetical protein [Paracraurococcus sp. LOR1-02]
MSITRHDFGKAKRQSLRRFRQLLSLDAMHEANIRNNPVPYLERASERIYQLEKALTEAAEAAKPPFHAPAATERVDIDRAEYERLLRCRRIVEDALAACRTEGENG